MEILEMKIADEKRKRGRPDNGFILKLVKLAFKDEAEYKRFLEMSTSRSRVEIVLNQQENTLKR